MTLVKLVHAYVTATHDTAFLGTIVSSEVRVRVRVRVSSEVRARVRVRVSSEVRAWVSSEARLLATAPTLTRTRTRTLTLTITLTLTLPP